MTTGQLTGTRRSNRLRIGVLASVLAVAVVVCVLVRRGEEGNATQDVATLTRVYQGTIAAAGIQSQKSLIGGTEGCQRGGLGGDSGVRVTRTEVLDLRGRSPADVATDIGRTWSSNGSAWIGGNPTIDTTDATRDRLNRVHMYGEDWNFRVDTRSDYPTIGTTSFVFSADGPCRAGPFTIGTALP